MKSSVARLSFGMVLFTVTSALAHSEQAVQNAFDRGTISQEVADATREFESTSAMNSLRADAHAKLHRLLAQYLQAKW